MKKIIYITIFCAFYGISFAAASDQQSKRTGSFLVSSPVPIPKPSRDEPDDVVFDSYASSSSSLSGYRPSPPTRSGDIQQSPITTHEKNYETPLYCPAPRRAIAASSSPSQSPSIHRALPPLSAKHLTPETAKKNMPLLERMFVIEAKRRAQSASSSLPQTKKEWQKIDVASLPLETMRLQEHKAVIDSILGDSPTQSAPPTLARHLSMPNVAALRNSIAPSTPPRQHALRSSLCMPSASSSSPIVGSPQHHTIFSAAVKSVIEKLLPQVSGTTLDQEQKDHPAGRSIIVQDDEHTVYIHMTVAKKHS